MPRQTHYQFLRAAVSAHLASDHPQECLLWPYGRNATGGYGMVWEQGFWKRVHRVAYEEFIGSAGTLDVLHHCDNPPCFNPLCLFLGTDSDNQRDCVAKGRHVPPDNSGERHGMHKLSEAQVREIRTSFRPGKGPHKNPNGTRGLAKRFGVCRVVIQRILHDKLWKHVNQ